MKRDVQIIPSLLSMDLSCMRVSLKSIPAEVKMLHLDVMDGAFVENITFGPVFLENLRPLTRKKIDAHLMVANPDKYAPLFVKAGADLVSFHPETSSNPVSLLKRIRAMGSKAGLAVNPDVNEKTILKYLNNADYVLLMSVFPGFAGQSFIKSVLSKLKRLKALQKNYDFKIEIDGGINEKTGRMAIEAGAEWIVSGSYLFKGKNMKNKIEGMVK
ncbi:MAG: ribulose-phosphate 3-epimerase [bacterium]|nr:ribulose-phosphate 3-epimerase [bacterium]